MICREIRKISLIDLFSGAMFNLNSRNYFHKQILSKSRIYVFVANKENYLSGCKAPDKVFVCVEVLRPSQPNGVMSSAVSSPNHTFTRQA